MTNAGTLEQLLTWGALDVLWSMSKKVLPEGKDHKLRVQGMWMAPFEFKVLLTEYGRFYHDKVSISYALPPGDKIFGEDHL